MQLPCNSQAEMLEEAHEICVMEGLAVKYATGQLQACDYASLIVPTELGNKNTIKPARIFRATGRLAS
ncbi:hypothetical protein EJG51_017450 [Undibacterium piscinae]|uniref:Uncharacterized protein n=1 Tax=Undibacterium piscinae TaxID=2495591 RepID=A0A6M4AA00_9BURK|nr:hypothetical protein EJG51_017450 [Undibacterium piscinae]